MIESVAIAVALDEAGGFAKNFETPWKDKPFYKKDLKRFKELTDGNIIAMGRHTYEEIHENKMSRGLREDGPLLWGRTSFVLSRNEEFKPRGAKRVGWLRGLMYEDEVITPYTIQTLFFLGGEKLFIEALPYTKDVYCTIVKGYYNCDKFFPITELTKKFEIRDGVETDDTYFVHYVRVMQ
jgi:dihydrofolate reductase